MSRPKLEQNGTQRKNIRARIQDGTQMDFWSHVARGSRDALSNRGVLRALLGCKARKSEIAYLDPLIRGHQNVFGFYVSMDDASAVSGSDSLETLFRDDVEVLIRNRAVDVCA